MNANKVIVPLLGATVLLQVANLYSIQKVKAGEPQQQQQQQVADIVGHKTFGTLGFPSKGSLNSPVTMVEFSDFECPSCARFATETLPDLEKKWIDTGKVRYVFADYPLSIHKNAPMLALAGACAANQRQFWPLHDLLFKEKPTTSEAVWTLAATIPGLNMGSFDRCAIPDPDPAIFKDGLDRAKALGITGTPSFLLGKGVLVVNLKKIVHGAVPIDVFNTAISAVLAGK